MAAVSTSSSTELDWQSNFAEFIQVLQFEQNAVPVSSDLPKWDTAYIQTEAQRMAKTTNASLVARAVQGGADALLHYGAR